MKIRTVLICMVFCFAVVSNVFALSLADYYPLNQGDSRTYHITGTSSQGTSFDYIEDEFIDGVEIVPYDGGFYGGVKRYQSDGSYDVLNINYQGLEIVKWNYEQFRTPGYYSLFGSSSSSQPTEPFLIAPTTFNIGDTFSVNYKSVPGYKEYAYSPQGQQLDTYKHTLSIELEGFEDVTVEAGTFKDALKIKQYETIQPMDKRYTSTHQGYMYVAKGVGEIKRATTETRVQGTNTTVSSSNQSLVSYKLAPPVEKTYGIFIGAKYSDGDFDFHKETGEMWDKFNDVFAFDNARDDGMFLVTSGGTEEVSKISQYISKLEVTGSDRVIFYYAGHGSVDPLIYGGETPVDVTSTKGFLSDNTSDEYLSFDSKISDDFLTTLFGVPKYDDVEKIFILDSCFSGGFKGDPSSKEWDYARQGDLNKLSNMRMFAAVDESRTGVAFGQQGSIFFEDSYGIYSVAIMDYLDEVKKKEDKYFSWNEMGAFLDEYDPGWLKEFLAGRDLDFDNIKWYETNSFPGSFAEIDFTLEDWGPIYLSQSTHRDLIKMKDLDATVPEPATMFLFGTGLIGGAFVRRKRKCNAPS